MLGAVGMEILRPVAVLAGWTMVMWLWMYATRIPAMQQAKVDIAGKVGGTGKDLDAVLPPQVQWISHNYNHLHEAPTVFYAVALTLAFLGQGGGWALIAAWLYVGLRIAHSLQQGLSNRVVVRFGLFALSSFALMVLVAMTIIAVFSA